MYKFTTITNSITLSPNGYVMNRFNYTAPTGYTYVASIIESFDSYSGQILYCISGAYSTTTTIGIKSSVSTTMTLNCTLKVLFIKSTYIS